MTRRELQNLPVWIYWEGELPEWISKCHKTIFNHASNVQLINAAEFDLMRENDRDLQIEELYVAHRADYIRSFLLAKFGGLWVDSDCVVLKSLKPLVELLDTYEFVGYKERSGEVTNNFMGASANSTIAARYYERVCRILRSNEPIEWLTLGSKALTATLNERSTLWYELAVEQIQPICWSNPAAFFQKRRDREHKAFLNNNSYCYMLSANMIRGYQSENRDLNLMDDDTFFSYLLRVSDSNRTFKVTATINPL